MIAFHGVQNQALVCFWDFQVGESSSIGEIQLSNHGLHAQTRELGVHLDVDRFVRLNANDELVARDVLKDARGHVFELDTDFGLLLIESCAGLSDIILHSIYGPEHTFTSLQNKGNAVPSLILDVQGHGAKGGTS